jgi:hypothetical protein
LGSFLCLLSSFLANKTTHNAGILSNKEIHALVLMGKMNYGDENVAGKMEIAFPK